MPEHLKVFPLTWNEALNFTLFFYSCLTWDKAQPDRGNDNRSIFLCYLSRSYTLYSNFILEEETWKVLLRLKPKLFWMWTAEKLSIFLVRQLAWGCWSWCVRFLSWTELCFPRCSPAQIPPDPSRKSVCSWQKTLWPATEEYSLQKSKPITSCCSILAGRCTRYPPVELWNWLDVFGKLAWKDSKVHQNHTKQSMRERWRKNYDYNIMQFRNTCL